MVEVEIGAFQPERGTTQRVCFNVVVEVAQVALSLIGVTSSKDDATLVWREVDFHHADLIGCG